MAADWTPLDDGDPLPGDPSGVSQLAGLLAADAAELRGVIDGLHQVDTCEIWSGENADRFIAAKDKAVPDLELVAKRMEDASRALNRFVPGMANSQALARTALFRARDAGERMARASAALDEDDRQRKAAEAAAAASSGPAGFHAPDSQTTLGPSWTGMRDEATEDFDAARRLFAAACKDYRDAGTTCAHDLGQAIDDHLKDHHSGGLLGGLDHAISTGIHGLESATSWVDHHLPSIDQVSEGLGFAAAIASLTGCEPLALALTSAKTAIDVGQALATGEHWDKVRDDAIGLALFGAGRVLTGVARGRVVVGATRHAQDLNEDMNALKAERGVTKDAAELKRITGSLRADQSKLQSLEQISDKYATDAPGHFWSRSVRMVRAEEVKLPAMKELSLRNSALVAAGTVKGIDFYGKVKEVKEVITKGQEWSDGHEILASETGPEG